MHLLDHVGAQGPGDLQDRLRIRDRARADAREGPIHQIGPDLVLERVVAPAIQVLQHEHAQHHLGGRAGTPAPPTLRPAGLQRRHDRIKHGRLLQQRVDPLEIGGPELAGIGQHDFPDTALTLATTDHAASVASSNLSLASGAVPHLRAIAVGEFAGNREEAMPRVHPALHALGQHVRHMQTARLAVAGPVRQLQRGVLLASGTATGGLAAHASAFGQRSEDHLAGQALQLFPQRCVGHRLQVIQ